MSPAAKTITVDGVAHALGTIAPEDMRAWREACLAALPSHKKYDVIYADPPWYYENAVPRDTPGKRLEGLVPYPMLKDAELEALPVRELAARDSVLFMWATGPCLDQAMRLVAAWGFKFKTVWKVWEKRTVHGRAVCGTGFWNRPSCEFLLVGARGKGHMKRKLSSSEQQEFASVRGAHSAKPPELREAVRAFLDVPSRIELFARDRAPGFDAWGLEVPGFFAPDPAADS